MIRDNYPNLDIKALSKQIDKSESKKAMPFINALKRRLDAGEPADVVLNRELAFNELDTLRSMVPGLKQTVQKCAVVEVILIEEGGKSGKVVGGTEGVVIGEERKELPASAEGAVPAQPTFFFENVQA